MENVREYVKSIIGAKKVVEGEVFAKILAPNDDSGRHGVVIPNSMYGFFPNLPIPDPTVNATVLFPVWDATVSEPRTIAWKYYQRYPERRATRLAGVLNRRDAGRRIAIFIRTVDRQGVVEYATDASVDGIDPRFPELFNLLFSSSSQTAESFVSLPIDVAAFRVDADLADLLSEFDRVQAMGWIPSLRTGDTGIGYTFETLLGIEENNDQFADFRGIEIKCKLERESRSPSGKINLFQKGPTWRLPGPMHARLQALGEIAPDGRLACYSQVTTTPNNKDLWLRLDWLLEGIDLLKGQEEIGSWTFKRLAERLAEKHSRAVFIKAGRRTIAGEHEYHYRELTYCERPAIDRFAAMVAARRIMFEFAMHLNPPKSVRNHGYPWRLVDVRELDQLFALQLTLRQPAPSP